MQLKAQNVDFEWYKPSKNCIKNVLSQSMFPINISQANMVNISNMGVQ